jgi:pre-mRNA-processing factor 40
MHAPAHPGHFLGKFWESRSSTFEKAQQLSLRDKHRRQHYSLLVHLIDHICRIDSRVGKMNGMNGVFQPPAGTWQEHRTQDGRIYYYNTITRITQWTKPEDMMTPAEVRLLGGCGPGVGEKATDLKDRSVP